MSLLEIKNLYVEYETKRGLSGKTQKIHAVNGINLEIKSGEIFAIAGESGCGKSTLSKTIMKLISPKSGEIYFDNKNIFEQNNINEFYKNIQIVFQNPYSSLNPKMKISEILEEPLKINTKYSKREINKIILENLLKVGLDDDILNLYPHEFSGGQRQRIAIARALMLNPKLIIADEPVSALDVSIQAQIINLIRELKRDMNLTFLFISHDLSVIRYISDRTAIMYLGEIVETGYTQEIFENPKHPYTQALLSVVPDLTTEKQDKTTKLNGELPSPEHIPTGCKFHTRCPYAKEICSKEVPPAKDFSGSHNCKCFLYDNNYVI